MNLFASQITDKGTALSLEEFARVNYAPNFQTCVDVQPWPLQGQIEAMFDSGNVFIACHDTDTGDMLGWRVDGIEESGQPPVLWWAFILGDQGGYGDQVPNFHRQIAAHMWAASWKAHGKIRNPIPADPEVNPIMAAAQIETQAMSRFLYEEIYSK